MGLLRVSGEMSCIILAGGRGTRFGHNKALETVGCKSLLQRVVDELNFFDSSIIIVTSNEHSFLNQKSQPGLREATDIFPGKAALGGLYTGLVASNSFYNLVVACDMPFLNRKLLHHMLQCTESYDAVVPRLNDKVEPLHAVYAKSCIPKLESLLMQRNLSIRNVFSMIRVRYIDDHEIDIFDPQRLSFFNVNTEAELDQARELAGQREGHDPCQCGEIPCQHNARQTGYKRIEGRLPLPIQNKI
jgi:molybdopterin-guanine dinucleotide biosynthesis protein A